METKKNKMNRNTISFRKVNSWLSAVYSQSSNVDFLPINRVMYRFDENGEKILLKDYYHIDMVYSHGFLQKNGIVEINATDKTMKWIANDSVENLTELLKTVAKRKKDESKERTRKKKEAAEKAKAKLAEKAEVLLEKIDNGVTPKDSDVVENLAQIIELWPELPEHIKAAIKALVKTHRTERQ